MIFFYPSSSPLWLLSFTLLFSCNYTPPEKTPPPPPTQIIKQSKTNIIQQPTIQLVDSQTIVRNARLLVSAINSNDIDSVQQLLEQGVNANSSVWLTYAYGDSPLRTAVYKKNYDIVKLLIEKGADPNLNLGKTLSPFHKSAVVTDSVPNPHLYKIFDLLLKKGGDVNTYNGAIAGNYSTPLMAAASNGDVEKVITLLENGAIIDPSPTNNFTSPLHAAVSKGQDEVLKIFLQKGANINAQYSIKGYRKDTPAMTFPEKITVMHALIRVWMLTQHKEKAKKMIDLVLRAQPNLTIETQAGLNPLEYLIANFAFKAFVDYGSDPYTYTLINKLIQHGAQLEKKGRMSALHYASTIHHHEILSFLLKKNININQQDEKGNTPLMYAILYHVFNSEALFCRTEGCIKRKLKTIEVLLDNGADLNIKNAAGESIMTLYEEGKISKDVVEVLEKKKRLKKTKN